MLMQSFSAIDVEGCSIEEIGNLIMGFNRKKCDKNLCRFGAIINGTIDDSCDDKEDQGSITEIVSRVLESKEFNNAIKKYRSI